MPRANHQPAGPDPASDKTPVASAAAANAAATAAATAAAAAAAAAAATAGEENGCVRASEEGEGVKGVPPSRDLPFCGEVT